MTNLPRGRPKRKMRPRKIAGVTVVPTWQWSASYTAHVRRIMKGQTPECAIDYVGHGPSPRERHEARAIQYARWLARRDGLDKFKREDGLTANKAECVWEYRQYGKPTVRTYSKVNGTLVMTLRRKTRPTFVKAVAFYYQAPGQRGQYWHNGWRGEPIERELIATVGIPNYDFEPTVTEGERPEERRAA